MSKLIKVREIITLKGWATGSGWSYDQCYNDSIINVTGIEGIDWDWYKTNEDDPPTEGEDTKIVVEFYAANADINEDEPLASHSKWVSEIWEERHN